VWPVSRGCLLFHGTWSYFCICRGPCCPALDFVFVFFGWHIVNLAILYTRRITNDYITSCGAYYECMYEWLAFLLVIASNEEREVPGGNIPEQINFWIKLREYTERESWLRGHKTTSINYTQRKNPFPRRLFRHKCLSDSLFIVLLLEICKRSPKRKHLSKG
jgi:hypothetical protein